MTNDKLEKGKGIKAKILELEHYNNDLGEMEGSIISFTKISSCVVDEKLNKKFNDVFEYSKKQLKKVVDEEIKLLEKQFEEL